MVSRLQIGRTALLSCCICWKLKMLQFEFGFKNIKTSSKTIIDTFASAVGWLLVRNVFLFRGADNTH